MTLLNVFSLLHLPSVTGLPTSNYRKNKKLLTTDFSLKTQAKLSRLCEQDKVVHALEEKLQQLHKEKVGQLCLLSTIDVTFYAYYQDTDKTKEN